MSNGQLNGNGRSHFQGPGTAFFTGVCAGVALGAGVGLLFAPRAGAELREQMAQSATSLGNAVSQTVDGIAQRGRAVVGRARSVASRVRSDIDRATNDASQARA